MSPYDLREMWKEHPDAQLPVGAEFLILEKMADTGASYMANPRPMGSLIRMNDYKYIFSDVIVRMGPSGETRRAIANARKQVKNGGFISFYLLPEPTNQHDPNALKVMCRVGQEEIFLGYVNKYVAEVQASLDKRHPDFVREITDGQFLRNNGMRITYACLLPGAEPVLQWALDSWSVLFDDLD